MPTSAIRSTAASTFDIEPVKRRSVIGLIVVAMASWAGCSTMASPDYQNVEIDTSSARKSASLGSGDVFEVRVHGHKDLTGVHRIAPDGSIDFPHVGRIPVDGLQPTAIADVLRTKLMDGYLRNPSVTVFVKEYNSKKIFVLGQVKKPGMFNFEDNMNIVQAIALAGGFTGLARSNYAIVKRVQDGIERRIPIPVEKIITDKGSKNFVLQPGDIVFVPETVL